MESPYAAGQGGKQALDGSLVLHGRWARQTGHSSQRWGESPIPQPSKDKDELIQSLIPSILSARHQAHTQ
eukprot:1161192-Pelagomonas_calceolata.AAC.2